MAGRPPRKQVAKLEREWRSGERERRRKAKAAARKQRNPGNGRADRGR